MYRHWIWDFDGTLFDTYPVMAKAFQTCLYTKYNIIEPIENIIEKMTISAKTANDFYTSKYNLDEEFFDYYLPNKSLEEIQTSKPFKNVFDICMNVWSSGKKNYLLTHRGNSAEEILKLNKMDVLFEECITSKNNFERKPNPQAIEYIIDKYNLNKKEVIMIGDRNLDIQAGKNAGVDTCYFKSTNTYIEASIVITDFNQLKKYLQ